MFTNIKCNTSRKELKFSNERYLTNKNQMSTVNFEHWFNLLSEM